MQTAAMLGIQDVRALVPHGEPYGRAQLLEIPYDEMGYRWIAGSEHKAHFKMARLFEQPYISPPSYVTVEFLSNEEILLA
jgi:hypothetical protein